ncbi:KATNB1-like protein 1 [Antedon mediterranea]|uniref:KATNB1-like protein 1 n=1 Tax=Antedon mediterranea TaxID=105859 RepID=UPI003AF97CAC
MADPNAKDRKTNEQHGFIKWDMKKKKYVMADPQEDEILRQQQPQQHKVKQKENAERPEWNNDFSPESQPPVNDSDLPDGNVDDVTQITSGHKKMTVILGNRLIQAKAAHTFWRKSPNSLISYLIRTNDDATTVDVLPFLSSGIKNKTEKGKQVTMGACLDFLPVLQRILDSKYEDYIVASLDMILGILRNWWQELVALGENPLNSRGLQCSRSTSGIYTSIVSMTDDINKLRKRDGKIGSKAKVIGDLLQKL